MHPTEHPDVLRARLFTGFLHGLWRTVADHHPGVAPGCGELPRFWVLRENVSLTVSVFGVYDLLSGEVLERATDRALVVARVAAANSTAWHMRQVA
ncbi:MAG TPA: hypothetical protein VF615_13625 [Longimicrobiaceae bacterium]